MNALIISDDQRSCLHLARRIERLGCNCWCARFNDELIGVLKLRPFQVVISTRPVTEGSPRMELLRAPERFIFYSFPVEDGSLWFQAMPAVHTGEGISARRPSEFMGILETLINSQMAQIEAGTPRRDALVRLETPQPLVRHKLDCETTRHR